MGKGARTRTANVEKLQKKRETAAQEAKKQKRGKLLTRVGLSAVAIILVAVIVLSVVNAVIDNSGSRLRNATAATSKTITVDNAVMSYFLHLNYNQFVNYYSPETLYYYYGFDTSGSLKRQQYSADGSWFDYFVQMTKSSLNAILPTAEAATAEGFALSDAEVEAITYRAALVKDGGFGKGVKQEDVARALQISALADRYNQHMRDSVVVSEADIDDYYAKNENTFRHASYYSYVLTYGDSEGQLSDEEALAKAKELKACTSEEEVRAWLKNVVNEANTSETAYTDEELESRVDAYLTEYSSYTADDEGSEWLYSEEATENASTIIRDEKSKKYTVYFVVSPAQRMEEDTVTVRHILVGTQEEADKVLNEWKAGDGSEELFGQLAFKYSLDEGSYAAGGIYENIYSGRMVEAFDAWCFDEARQPGDCDIVETDYGFHVMYFCGEGMTRWQSDVKEVIIDEKVSETASTFTSLYPVTYDDAVINKIPA